jgi:hypothetical protein
MMVGALIKSVGASGIAKQPEYERGADKSLLLFFFF